ncbi:hydrogenase nickel insertion protein HypA [Hyphomicrobium denitrificans 1NES1]|uniref:Hydrogenase maturation factor HypA n=1 Tax=Hyphomicrobium denitrificans 1NES1 TaxID=670307 RepID=N0B9X1_9HYPH|nr:hydrogenase maturation nickel metallochaperone HypA [Hyphomicrobium denitrificans]AGK57346.1 hydrogenase nickel insertion protein HypA [Hyphomicrobium denitrificans 1NES1]
MHEMAISESIVGILEEEARRQNFARVKKVRLEIGALVGIEQDALRFSFDVVTKGTLAEDAVLEIIATQARAWCMSCERVAVINHRYDVCPICGGQQLQVEAGDEMRIKDLEVD